VRPKPDWTSSAIKRNAVLVAEIDQDLEIIRRRRDKAAFSENRLGNHGRNFFVGHDTFERVF